jgi:hypothetical protein
VTLKVQRSVLCSVLCSAMQCTEELMYRVVYRAVYRAVYRESGVQDNVQCGAIRAATTWGEKACVSQLELLGDCQATRWRGGGWNKGT